MKRCVLLVSANQAPRGTNRMLKKSASGVLASLRGSTRVSRKSEALEGLFRSPRPIAWANGPTKCGPYLLASSLAAVLPAERRVLARRGWAGEKSGLFEHPEVFEAVAPSVIFHRCFICKPRFSPPARRFGPVILRFTFHVSRLTPLVEQLQCRSKALCPPFAEHILKLYA